MALTNDKVKSLKVGDSLYQVGSGGKKEVTVIAIGTKHFYTDIQKSRGAWSLIDGESVMSNSAGWRELFPSKEVYDLQQIVLRMRTAVVRFFQNDYNVRNMTGEELQRVCDICMEVQKRIER